MSHWQRANMMKCVPHTCYSWGTIWWGQWAVNISIICCPWVNSWAHHCINTYMYLCITYLMILTKTSLCCLCQFLETGHYRILTLVMLCSMHCTCTSTYYNAPLPPPPRLTPRIVCPTGRTMVPRQRAERVWYLMKPALLHWSRRPVTGRKCLPPGTCNPTCRWDSIGGIVCVL